MKNTDLRTKAFVLRRTNYGEADRIVNFLTPEGKISAIAKSVRKEKSKLAGNIELFCLVDINVHQHQSNPDHLAILTGAKMLKNYPKIISDLTTLEFASNVLKSANRAAEHVQNEALFDIVQQVFEGLENDLDPKLVELWFAINLAQTSGEAINFYRDTNGDKLQPDQNYLWDSTEFALRPDPQGNITTNEIKFERLLASNKLAVAAKVKNFSKILPPLTAILLK